MFCQKCGKENSEGGSFCGSCGASIAPTGAENQASGSENIPGGQMTFRKSISTCLSKYVDFDGRASRPEYWWFFLFYVIIVLLADIFDPSGIIYVIVYLALFLPSIAVGARRLHDTGRSGWWQLISITVIGIIPLIIWLASKGSNQTNKYGPAL